MPLRGHCPKKPGFGFEPLLLTRNGIVDKLCETLHIIKNKGHQGTLRFDNKNQRKAHSPDLAGGNDIANNGFYV
jgi:hypothetical protein